MCGIFGVITKEDSNYSNNFLKKSLITLAKLSETRGKDSSGLCTLNQKDHNFDIVKGPIPANQLLKRNKVKDIIKDAFSKENKDNLKLAFGHARLVTNGTQLEDKNNQPVVKEDIICVHNGIVVNVNELWSNYTKLNRKYEIDTEVIPALVRMDLNEGNSVESSVVNSIEKVFGTVSIAITFTDIQKFILATNNGSLYILNNNEDIIYFASERAILNGLVERMSLKDKIGSFELFQLKANHIFTINTNNFTFNEKSFLDIRSNSSSKEVFIDKKNKINLFSEKSKKKQISTVLDLNDIHLNPNAKKDKELLIYPIDKIKSLKRCTKCILPETFPFIEYDEKGECNLSLIHI